MTPPSGVDPAVFARLVSIARDRARSNEPAHDFSHVARVVENARRIARAEGEPEAVPVVAALLHELFTLPKDHPDSPRAGDFCAEHAREVLRSEGAPSDLVEPACLAIRDHAFSKGVVPELAGARILQDADRLDALGAIGLARMWATCADMKRPFYSAADPFCRERVPDDKLWGLDHVAKKLLLLPDKLHTKAARAMAAERFRFIRQFVDQLAREIGDPGG